MKQLIRLTFYYNTWYNVDFLNYRYLVKVEENGMFDEPHTFTETFWFFATDKMLEILKVLKNYPEQSVLYITYGNEKYFNMLIKKIIKGYRFDKIIILPEIEDY